MLQWVSNRRASGQQLERRAGRWPRTRRGPGRGWPAPRPARLPPSLARIPADRRGGTGHACHGRREVDRRRSRGPDAQHQPIELGQRGRAPDVTQREQPRHDAVGARDADGGGTADRERPDGLDDRIDRGQAPVDELLGQLALVDDDRRRRRPRRPRRWARHRTCASRVDGVAGGTVAIGCDNGTSLVAIARRRPGGPPRRSDAGGTGTLGRQRAGVSPSVPSTRPPGIARGQRQRMGIIDDCMRWPMLQAADAGCRGADRCTAAGTAAQARTGKVPMPSTITGSGAEAGPRGRQRIETRQVLADRDAGRQQPVWTGRRGSAVSSMLSESMPTRVAPPATRWSAAASGQEGMARCRRRLSRSGGTSR